MALPSSRVIGHKEYGNTYSPGRKQDPTYSMDWRRSRVANFKPRGGTTTEDDMAQVSQEQFDKLAAQVDELHDILTQGIAGRRKDGAVFRVLRAIGTKVGVDVDAVLASGPLRR